MKALIIAEQQQGRLLETCYEGLAFCQALGAESEMFLSGTKDALPQFGGKLHLAAGGDYNPKLHRDLIVQLTKAGGIELVVFAHSSYGWDLAPRVALALGWPQLSEVVGLKEGQLEQACYNAKLRRQLAAPGPKVVTLQSGAFPAESYGGSPQVTELAGATDTRLEFVGYEAAPPKELDLTKSEIIVSAGRGIGKPENLALVRALADALKGDLGASRPVVDAGWVPHSHQVGTTGQTVSPKLYVACGISGAIQHLAGMKKSNFIVAINTDKDAPIAEVADVVCVADLVQFLPILTAKVKG